jgi:hypothetical protein
MKKKVSITLSHFDMKMDVSTFFDSIIRIFLPFYGRILIFYADLRK